MPLFQKCCFFDVSGVVGILPDLGFRYHPHLPGYLGDLFSTHQSLVGLVFSSWSQKLPDGGLGDLREALYGQFGMPPLRIHELVDEDPIASLQALQRRMSLDLARCSIYLSPVGGTRMERIAREAGIGDLRVLDSRYQP